MISADNLRRKFLIVFCEPGRARFAENNKEFSRPGSQRKIRNFLKYQFQQANILSIRKGLF